MLQVCFLLWLKPKIGARSYSILTQKEKVKNETKTVALNANQGGGLEKLVRYGNDEYSAKTPN